MANKFEDFERWAKLSGTQTDDRNDTERYKYAKYRASVPAGDVLYCTLCGAAVAPSEKAKKSHHVWHGQMALAADMAEQYWAARGELETELARADTLELRKELASGSAEA